MLEQILSIKNEKAHKVVRIFGIKIKFKTKFLKLKSELKSIKEANENLRCRMDNIQQRVDDLQKKIKASESVIIYEQRPEEFILKREQLSYEEYKKLVDGLYKNLDDEAKRNLDRIFEKKDKLYYNGGSCLANEIFNKEELELRNEVLKFNKDIKKIDDYYQWKNYKLPRNFFEPSVIFYGGGAREIKNKEYVENKTILDVGCFLADSVLVFNEVFKNTTIHSFEPDLYNYNDSLKTLELNNVVNTKIINAGVCENSDGAYIYHCGSVGSHLNDYRGVEKIKTTTIDEYVMENNLNVGLIKVDVEGLEQKVIQGAINTIKKQRPVLLLSIYHNFEDFFQIKPIIEKISDDGYTFNFVQPVLPFNVTYEIMLVAEPKL